MTESGGPLGVPVAGSPRQSAKDGERLARLGYWLLVPWLALCLVDVILDIAIVSVALAVVWVVMVAFFVAAVFKLGAAVDESRAISTAYALTMIVQPFALVLLWWLTTRARDVLARLEAA